MRGEIRAWHREDELRHQLSADAILEIKRLHPVVLQQAFMAVKPASGSVAVVGSKHVEEATFEKRVDWLKSVAAVCRKLREEAP